MLAKDSNVVVFLDKSGSGWRQVEVKLQILLRGNCMLLFLVCFGYMSAGGTPVRHVLAPQVGIQRIVFPEEFHQRSASA